MIYTQWQNRGLTLLALDDARDQSKDQQLADGTAQRPISLHAGMTRSRFCVVPLLCSMKESCRWSTEEDAEFPFSWLSNQQGTRTGEKSSPTKSETLSHDSKLLQSAFLLLTGIHIVPVSSSFSVSLSRYQY